MTKLLQRYQLFSTKDMFCDINLLILIVFDKMSYIASPFQYMHFLLLTLGLWEANLGPVIHIDLIADAKLKGSTSIFNVLVMETESCNAISSSSHDELPET